MCVCFNVYLGGSQSLNKTIKFVWLDNFNLFEIKLTQFSPLQTLDIERKADPFFRP